MRTERKRGQRLCLLSRVARHVHVADPVEAADGSKGGDGGGGGCEMGWNNYACVRIQALVNDQTTLMQATEKGKEGQRKRINTKTRI